MKKEKIKRILIDSINSFEDIEGYELIGLIGSIIKKGNESQDVDLVSIGKLETHNKFKNYLVEKFQEKNINILFFETILNKPKKDKNRILIHDLYYKDINDLLKREWKTIINEMKKNIKLIYGDNLISKLPKQKILKKDLCLPILKWINNINNYKRYKLFKEHLLLYTLKDFYDYGFKKEGDKIKKFLNSSGSWKEKLTKIKKVLR